MSKATAVFSRTPIKNVNHSPASVQLASGKPVKSQQTVSSLAHCSPRKYKIHTEIQSTQKGVNVTNKVQSNCPVSPRTTQDRRNVKPSPRANQQDASAGSRMRHEPARNDLFPNWYWASNSINLKSMRSCFEPKQKEKDTKLPNKPPPSPSPSRARSRVPDIQPVTPRNNNSNNIKGILSSRSRYNSPSFRLPSGSNTPTRKPAKLRRSVSADPVSRLRESPRISNLARSASQMLTPKHRVQFCEHGSKESLAAEVTNVTVAVRVRPAFKGERNAVSLTENTVKVKALGSEQCFSYDFIFDPDTCQLEVFDVMVKPLVEAAIQGYNVCLFAYGQTGTGKTYSMMGEEGTYSSHNMSDRAGIIPRFSQDLFRIIEGSEEYSHTKVEISYFEIYNEKIHDLLGPSQIGRSAPLRVREHPELGPYVANLTVLTVHSFETLQDWLNVGNAHRETAATEMNLNSSWSHTIFTVTLTQSQANDRPSLCSKVNLIDLAGSERLAHMCANADRLKEGVSINRSLLTLGKVISSLAENKKRGFIPYRESVLTWLLRESLGGNSRTAMLATISGSSQFVDETLSTLRYAGQAQKIINKVRINECAHEKRIRELKEEIQRLAKANASFFSLTKELLEVKSQLRAVTWEKESSESLCSQLQEQLIQQERAVSQSRRQLFDDNDKENWETPSKVIRRSIAQLSDSSKANDRCSLVLKAEEIHQAVKDAEDICPRLNIPYVFQLEPEVTTHSLFDVNVRVWDQRTMTSVRWPSQVFLSWMREMKELMCKSRDHKLLHGSSSAQKRKDAELVDSADSRRIRHSLQEEVDGLQCQVARLDCVESMDEMVSAIHDMINDLKSQINHVSPLRSKNVL